jgi:small subunit ribosomal protein S5
MQRCREVYTELQIANCKLQILNLIFAICNLKSASFRRGVPAVNESVTQRNLRKQPIVANERIQGELTEKVIKIKRCAAVVKGGRRFSFAAMVVVGNGHGRVGWGYGKANEVPPAVEKAQKDASRSMIDVPMDGGTIPHTVKGHFGSADVILIPASPGTGVIAGAAVRAVCEAAGIRDVLSKSFGSTNPVNLTKATMNAITQLRPKQEVERLRGVSLV